MSRALDNDLDNDSKEEEKEEVDEDYLVALHQHLKEKKKLRKETENEVHALGGRLRCLKDEQKKEEQKIQMGKKKREKMQAALNLQEAELNRKMEYKKKKDEELEKKRIQNKQRKEANKQAILNKKEEMKKKIEEGAKMMKDLKKTNKENKKVMLLEDATNKKTQADFIKSQQLIGEEKRRAIELEKKNKIKEELERKIREEDEKIASASNQKQNLEEEEVQIMNKLKRTTRMHENLEKNIEIVGNSKKK